MQMTRSTAARIALCHSARSLGMGRDLARSPAAGARRRRSDMLFGFTGPRININLCRHGAHRWTCLSPLDIGLRGAANPGTRRVVPARAVRRRASPRWSLSPRCPAHRVRPLPPRNGCAASRDGCGRAGERFCRAIGGCFHRPDRWQDGERARPTCRKGAGEDPRRSRAREAAASPAPAAQPPTRKASLRTSQHRKRRRSISHPWSSASRTRKPSAYSPRSRSRIRSMTC